MLDLFGLIVAIVMTVFTYRTAKDNGRRAALWAAGTFGAAFLGQVIIPAVVTIVFVFVMLAKGTPQNKLVDSLPAFAIGIGGVGLGIVLGFLVLRQAAQLPDDPVLDGPPEPPPVFE